ncbi:MAG: hypothetical protein A2896_00915 [Candidatus Nealsonbacteria bacterium RIFCSPLOWO2_01_FULL_43_32]|uniref:Nudix hydrolase domain-containing protein n=1 Tax=Candidatus Nealsonbacteria bacterium RIFCSPLOWO2_01_FULL_43_32 TaxID=1801672 RepID=A0A1G2EEZ3_9BACT|nr:MAG: hypothetical protein A2896_00915 [Candidatus Nealsonbacteria bacterium RIFCSPLOWO2_01_FULL_43_32]
MGRIEEIAERLGLSGRLPEVQFLATGFKAVDLEGLARFEDELQIFDLAAHQDIRANWEAKVAKNPKMFPGPMATVKDFKVEEKVLKLRLQRSRFDIYDGLRPRIPNKIDLAQKPLDRDFCLPLSTGAVTVTAPDKENPAGTIIFGIRSKTTAFGEGISTTLPAGYFNPESDRLVIGDPALHVWLMSIRFTVVREMKEEVGLQDYQMFDYLGLIHDGVLAKQPLLAVRLGLDFTAEEVKAVAHDMGVEVQSYHFVPNTEESVREFIAKYPPTPHTIGALILHFA